MLDSDYPVPNTSPPLNLEINLRSRTQTPSPVVIIHVLNLAIEDMSKKSPRTTFPAVEQVYTYGGVRFSMAVIFRIRSFTYLTALKCVKAFQQFLLDEKKYGRADVRVRWEEGDKRIVAFMQLGNPLSKPLKPGEAPSVSTE